SLAPLSAADLSLSCHARVTERSASSIAIWKDRPEQDRQNKIDRTRSTEQDRQNKIDTARETIGAPQSAPSELTCSRSAGERARIQDSQERLMFRFPSPLRAWSALALLAVTLGLTTGCGGPASNTAEVDMGIATFQQDSVTIKAGQTVHFTDPDSG